MHVTNHEMTQHKLDKKYIWCVHKLTNGDKKIFLHYLWTLGGNVS